MCKNVNCNYKYLNQYHDLIDQMKKRWNVSSKTFLNVRIKNTHHLVKILDDTNEILYKTLVLILFVIDFFFFQKKKKTLLTDLKPKNEITSEKIDGFEKVEMSKEKSFLNNGLHKWFD